MSDYDSQLTLQPLSRVGLIIASSLSCALMYFASYIYAKRKLPFFTQKFDAGQRADWCSRTASQVHSSLIVLAILATLPRYSWSDSLQTSHSLDWVHGWMCFSLGYFLYDLTLVVVTRMESWPLYVVHHCAASTPLIAVLFMGCQRYSFLITAFFLVEVTTVTVNTSYWLESLGMENRKRYKFCVHFSFWAWLIFRIVMPFSLFYVMIDRMIVRGDWSDVGSKLKAIEGTERSCAATCSVSALLIIAYCNLVFVKSMAPAYIKRLRARYAKIQAALKARKERKANEKLEKEKLKKK